MTLAGYYPTFGNAGLACERPTVDNILEADMPYTKTIKDVTKNVPNLDPKPEPDIYSGSMLTGMRTGFTPAPNSPLRGTPIRKNPQRKI